MSSRSSQSPRAQRASTNDPEAYAKGKVQLETTSHDGKEAASVISEFSKQDRDGSGWPPAV